MLFYDSFSDNVNQVIEVATALSKRYGCKYIGSEHILFGLMNVADGRAAAILRQAEVDNDRYIYLFKKTIQPNYIVSGAMFTPRTKHLFEKSIDIKLQSMISNFSKLNKFLIGE